MFLRWTISAAHCGFLTEKYKESDGRPYGKNVR